MATFSCRLILLGFILSSGSVRVSGATPIITTVVGTGAANPNPPSTGQKTNLGYPFGVEMGRDDGLYICEITNHRIWQWNPQSDRLRVVAGIGEQGYSGDGGLATKARLNEPYEVRFDAYGNMYFVEMMNHIVRRVDAQTGIIQTIAGRGEPGADGDHGPAAQARLNRPHSIALDNQGFLYIADIGNHRIRRVDLTQGTITSIAGTGEKRLPQPGQPLQDQPVLGPRALFIRGRTMWVALREGHSVWRVNLDRPVWQHVAGTGAKGYSGDGGPATLATFNGPKGIAVDRQGNIYVVDTENQAVRLIEADSNKIRTLAGSGPAHRGSAGDQGPADQCELDRPHGVCVDRDGNVYVGDTGSNRVRRVGTRP